MSSKMISDRQLKILADRVNRVIDESALEFGSELPGLVADLRAAAQKGDHQTMGRIAYHLKGSGGTFGWPQITAASAILVDLIRQTPDGARLLQPVTAMETLIKDGLKGQTARGWAIVRDLRAAVETAAEALDR